MAAHREKFELYRDRSGQWRWLLWSGNGRIIAEAKGYNRKHDAIRAIGRVVRLAPTAWIEVRPHK